MLAVAGLDPLLTILADVPYSFAHSYELATIPLYILLGHVAQRVGITSDVFGALRIILSGTRTGLVMASLGGCAGFSAISGSSVACAAAMGRVAVPEMLSRGYSQTLAAGAVAAGAPLILGIIVGGLVTGLFTVIQAFTVLVAGADMSTAMIEWMTASSIDGWMVIAVIVLALLLMGMFLDPAGIILLAVPVTLPVVTGLGYDVVWYAVIFVKVLEIGLITPPLGLNIFALKASLDASDSVSLESIYEGALAFLAIDLVVLALLLAFPEISLLLPNLLS